MASVTNAAILRQRITALQKVYDAQAGVVVRFKINLADGDPVIRERLDKIATHIASASNEAEALIRDLDNILR